uniref:Uncharacterized protein n=1 Tax=Heterorhabditis bacteriophora TaxID=37862 RepID=A0A1I7WAJ9_HETBA
MRRIDGDNRQLETVNDLQSAISKAWNEIDESVIRNLVNILQAVEVIVLEMLYVQHLELGSVYNAFRSNANNLFAWASQQTHLLWILFLHDARKEERRF